MRARRRCSSVCALTAILFVGDVVGSAGRRVVRTHARRAARASWAPTSSSSTARTPRAGIGITPKHADELFAAGADVITLGNHTYRHREVWPYLEANRAIIRPGQLPARPSRAAARRSSSATGTTLGVVNLAGNLYMNHAAPALLAPTTRSRQVVGADHVLVDMHAEATSEKVALGWYLDGRVTAVVGTHTHVPTADARVLPGGTAYITDVGMTGARGGVIGVRREQSIAVMRTHMPQRYDPAEDDPWINAVLIRCGADGRATAIEPVLRPEP